MKDQFASGANAGQNSAMHLDLAKIKRLREQLGLSSRGAAKAAGISHQRWITVETDPAANPSLDTIRRMGQVLQVDGTELLKRN